MRDPQLSTAHVIAKRALDLVVGSLALVVLSPLMLVLAIMVRIDSPGPALFRQSRIGLNGQPFTMIKFRTMQHGNDESQHREYYRALIEGTAESRESGDGEKVFLLDDPRVTRTGAWLRKLSLDELPNLFNVLGGSMSLVGPRPPIDYEVDMYDTRSKGKLAAKPGMTGLAQVSGRGTLTFDEIIDLDLEYIEKRSFFFDVGLLFRTVPAVLRRRGV